MVVACCCSGWRRGTRRSGVTRTSSSTGRWNARETSGTSWRDSWNASRSRSSPIHRTRSPYERLVIGCVKISPQLGKVQANVRMNYVAIWHVLLNPCWGGKKCDRKEFVFCFTRYFPRVSLCVWRFVSSVFHAISPRVSGSDGRVLLPHGAPHEDGRHVQDGEAPTDGAHPSEQLPVRGPTALAHLPRTRLHHQGVHATGNVLLPLFSGDVSSEFQSQSWQSCSRSAEAYVLNVPRDSHLRRHLLTSCKQALVGLKTGIYCAADI